MVVLILSASYDASFLYIMYNCTAPRTIFPVQPPIWAPADHMSISAPTLLRCHQVRHKPTHINPHQPPPTIAVTGKLCTTRQHINTLNNVVAKYGQQRLWKSRTNNSRSKFEWRVLVQPVTKRNQNGGEVRFLSNFS